jgi:hypothetical protein
MKNLSSFFNKFKNFIPPEFLYKDEIINIISKVVKVTLTRKEIEINKNLVRVKTIPIKRNTIFLKKNEILKELKEILGDRSPKDIV